MQEEYGIVYMFYRYSLYVAKKKTTRKQHQWRKIGMEGMEEMEGMEWNDNKIDLIRLKLFFLLS